ncbi:MULTISPECIES: cytochrome c oxidase assembly protein [Ensifer]|uniref:Cytochrome c oxidase assembly protein n=1 Tax=Ensifer adhaerens TaxID=106592 RepID=A0ABY8HRL9_ENSAD|nr:MULTISPECIES: cytochrome c oxidase assembly protein [Ensifer]ANK77483.1 cytochrome-c oxidase [Ensifer adhaerens]KDP72313.1 cytochrome C oxidase [Ensifer adhaerens]KQZ54187.1 cytochrome C oxidase [Ensifer sp. Root558]WFP94752.1 cytochrome c oxidase assembly protein [Ensifer adhaerens]SFH34130.1 putative membrane protein [Ensifer sp. OV372]
MRVLWLANGCLLLAVIWLGPLLSAWRGSVTAHMLAHMGVVAVAAPLIAIGVAPRLASCRRPVLTGLPIVASLVELLVVWGWHAPAARRLAESSLWGTALEQACFLAAGLFLWSTCLAAGSTNRSSSNAAGTFGLLLTSVHMTLLGALLALSPRTLYQFGDVTCFGTTLTAAQDQQLGAVVMLMVGAAAYLAGGVALLSGLLAEPNRRVA